MEDNWRTWVRFPPLPPFMNVQIDISPIISRLDNIVLEQRALKSLIENLVEQNSRNQIVERSIRGPVFLRLKDVKIKTGLSNSSIYRRISEGQFPKQKKLGGRSVRWLESDIDQWIKERIIQ